MCVLCLCTARALLFSAMNRFVFNPFAEIAMCKLFHVRYMAYRYQHISLRLLLSLCVQVKSISSICLSFNSTQKSSIWYYLISFHPLFPPLAFASLQEANEEILICLCVSVCFYIFGRLNEWVPGRFSHSMENENKQTRAIETDRQFKKWMCMCIVLLLLLLHLLRGAHKTY